MMKRDCARSNRHACDVPRSCTTRVVGLMRPSPAGRGNARGAQATTIGVLIDVIAIRRSSIDTLMPRGRRNLYGGSASIDRQNRALDETGAVARQKHDRLGNLL